MIGVKMVLINMKPEYIRKAAHAFGTDEETIEKFIHDFFSAPNIAAALEVQEKFVDAHISNIDPEAIDEFIIDRGENNGT